MQKNEGTTKVMITGPAEEEITRIIRHNFPSLALIEMYFVFHFFRLLSF